MFHHASGDLVGPPSSDSLDTAWLSLGHRQLLVPNFTLPGPPEVEVGLVELLVNSRSGERNKCIAMK